MMDLLSDALLFGGGPGEGSLLFGSITQDNPGTFGGTTRHSRPYEPTKPTKAANYHAPGILTFEEQAEDDDEVAAALILMLARMPL